MMRYALDMGVDAGFFAARGRQVAETGLAGYHTALASIRSRFAGRPVAATESVAAPLCRALGSTS